MYTTLVKEQQKNVFDSADKKRKSFISNNKFHIFSKYKKSEVY